MQNLGSSDEIATHGQFDLILSRMFAQVKARDRNYKALREILLVNQCGNPIPRMPLFDSEIIPVIYSTQQAAGYSNKINGLKDPVSLRPPKAAAAFVRTDSSSSHPRRYFTGNVPKKRNIQCKTQLAYRFSSYEHMIPVYCER